MRSEALQTPDKIEDRHLDAIQHADFVWFFAPDGYVDRLAHWKLDSLALVEYRSIPTQR